MRIDFTPTTIHVRHDVTVNSYVFSMPPRLHYVSDNAPIRTVYCRRRIQYQTHLNRIKLYLHRTIPQLRYQFYYSTRLKKSFLFYLFYFLFYFFYFYFFRILPKYNCGQKKNIPNFISARRMRIDRQFSRSDNIVFLTRNGRVSFGRSIKSLMIVRSAAANSHVEIFINDRA